MKKIVICILSVLALSAGAANERNDDTGNSFFVFEPDIRLFTTYAFMNAAGFDADYAPMHPVRIRVRRYLDSVLTDEYKDKIRNFYDEHGGGRFYAYGAFALSCSFPPELSFCGDAAANEVFRDFYGYDVWLREFYETADIESLWAKHKEELTAINMKDKPYANIALRQITDFCRADSSYYRDNVQGHFYYQRIPLLVHFTGFYSEPAEDCWIVFGPGGDEEGGPGAFYHESLHKIVNPIVHANSKLNERLKELLPSSQEKLKGDYNDLNTLICESFVRTIDRFLTNDYYHHSDKDKLYTSIEDEYKLGHILCFFLMENVPEYLQSGMTLSEYYPILISKIDVDKEIARWDCYWKIESGGS